MARPAWRHRCEHGNAVDLGQAEVEHDGVIGLGVAEKMAFLAIAGGIDGIAGGFQRGDDLAVADPCRLRSRAGARSHPFNAFSAR